jgi:hypothetical protein
MMYLLFALTYLRRLLPEAFLEFFYLLRLEKCIMSMEYLSILWIHFSGIQSTFLNKYGDRWPYSTPL